MSRMVKSHGMTLERPLIGRRSQSTDRRGVRDRSGVRTAPNEPAGAAPLPSNADPALSGRCRSVCPAGIPPWIGDAEVAGNGRGVDRSPSSSQQSESYRIQRDAEDVGNRDHRLRARRRQSPRCAANRPLGTVRRQGRTSPGQPLRSTSIDRGTGAAGSRRTLRVGCPAHERSSVLR